MTMVYSLYSINQRWHEGDKATNIITHLIKTNVYEKLKEIIDEDV